MFFFLAISFALFSLSTACLFGETSFLIPPLIWPFSILRGGGGGLNLKAEEVSLPSWGLLYYFFSPVGCRHLPYKCLVRSMVITQTLTVQNWLYSVSENGVYTEIA